MTAALNRRVLTLRRTLMAGVVTGACFLLLQYESKPPSLAVSDVPIAFWAWRTNAPDEADVKKAFAATGAKVLFLRAGQFDLVNSDVQRIREVGGTIPKAAELHLVYNGTRDFLAAWNAVRTNVLADKIAGTYIADTARSKRDGADVNGLQLDFDVPTRLLPEYAKTLKELRKLLPPSTQLSITGLPTWIDSNDIALVLNEVDFWIPQCYGAKIPDHPDRHIPISSTQEVERTIRKVRQLNKPFFAGLSAYGYAILYGIDGVLIELRGNIDPAHAAMERGLVLTDRRTFSEGRADSAVRYAYRAKSDVVLNGLTIRQGERLVFDQPTAALLRASAAAVRENAGEQLRGICLFRLPSDGDPATLTAEEIVAALTDTDTQAATTIAIAQVAADQFVIRVVNKGSASSLISEAALKVDVNIEAGTLVGISQLDRFDSYETLCGNLRSVVLQPCAASRASVVRLKASSWRPGSSGSALVRLRRSMPALLSGIVTTHIDDGRTEKTAFDVQTIEGNEK